MLTLKFETEKSLLEPLYAKLGAEGTLNGANFVFYDGETPVGFWRIILENGCAVADEIRYSVNTGEGDVEFFTHAVLFKLKEGAPILFKIKGERREFEKFGFVCRGGYTEIFTPEINLHYGCGGAAGVGRTEKRQART
jgi:hypothetical protein